MARFLITGGAGFIGINAALHYAQQGNTVTVLDDFSRRGTKENVDWLRRERPDIRVAVADIRTDRNLLLSEAQNCDVLLHLAAQVAVTTSVADPRTDFEINAFGTFNVLEAARQASKPPILLYSSTNKVYGGMEELRVIEENDRYRYGDLPNGIGEYRPLDFHSPYGCSKGAADQYVRDYARIYGMRTVVFRQSCIYGLHQFGIEDQGWVAWFTLCNLLDRSVTIYGDGKQVRDVLYVEDLIKAFDAAIDRIDQIAGRVYNIGGGPTNTLSILELVKLLERIGGSKMNYSFGAWRPGDQRVYVSDISGARRDLDWKPQISPETGVAQMREWMAGNLETIVGAYRGQAS
jgi:CDP-paratose 2-epimerase